MRKTNREIIYNIRNDVNKEMLRDDVGKTNTENECIRAKMVLLEQTRCIKMDEIKLQELPNK